jgi:hypothetical protein
MEDNQGLIHTSRKRTASRSPSPADSDEEEAGNTHAHDAECADRPQQDANRTMKTKRPHVHAHNGQQEDPAVPWPQPSTSSSSRGNLPGASAPAPDLAGRGISNANNSLVHDRHTSMVKDKSNDHSEAPKSKPMPKSGFPKCVPRVIRMLISS